MPSQDTQTSSETSEEFFTTSADEGGGGNGGDGGGGDGGGNGGDGGDGGGDDGDGDGDGGAGGDGDGGNGGGAGGGEGDGGGGGYTSSEDSGNYGGDGGDDGGPGGDDDGGGDDDDDDDSDGGSATSEDIGPGGTTSEDTYWTTSSSSWYGTNSDETDGGGGSGSGDSGTSDTSATSEESTMSWSSMDSSIDYGDHRVIWVNNGDKDGDSIPDFADGYDILESTPSGNSSAKFHGIPVSVPIGTDLENTFLRVDYDASNPADVTHVPNMGDAINGYFYQPASGGLRVWSADGHLARRKAEIDVELSPNVFGNYVQPGKEYRFADLKFDTGTDGFHHFGLYVEGISLSQVKGDRPVTVTLTLPEQEPSANTIKFTVLDTGLVKVTGPETVEAVDVTKPSLPAPYFENVDINVMNVRPSNDGSRILADLSVRGYLKSQLCDTVPGDDGTIDEIQVYVNDFSAPLEEKLLEEDTLLNEVHKQEENSGDFTSPFPFYLEFFRRYEGVELIVGPNQIRLEAGCGFTDVAGYYERDWDVIPQYGHRSPTTVNDYKGLETALNFNGKTAQNLTETDPVLLRLQIADGDGLERTLYKVNSDPLVLKTAGDDAAWVIVAEPTGKLVQPVLPGNYPISVNAPSMGVHSLVARVVPQPNSSWLLSAYISLSVHFNGALDSTELDTIDAILIRGELKCEATLAETGVNTRVFGDADLRVELVSIPAFDDEVTEKIKAKVTCPALSLTGFECDLNELAVDSLTFETNTGASYHYPAVYGRTFGFTFSAGEMGGVQPRYSDKGTFNQYGISFHGPSDVLDELSDKPTCSIQNVRGHYLSVDKQNGHALRSLLLGPNYRMTPPRQVDMDGGVISSLSDQAKFLAGFGVGFAKGFGQMVGDSVGFLCSATKVMGKFNEYSTVLPYRYITGDSFQKEKLAFQSVKELGAGIGEIVWQMKQKELELYMDLFRGDLSSTNNLLKNANAVQMAALMWTADLISDWWQDISTITNPFEQGKKFGMFMYGVFDLLQPYTKAGSLSKVGKLKFLEELKSHAVVAEVQSNIGPKIDNAIARVTDLLKPGAELGENAAKLVEFYQWAKRTHSDLEPRELAVFVLSHSKTKHLNGATLELLLIEIHKDLLAEAKRLNDPNVFFTYTELSALLKGRLKLDNLPDVTMATIKLKPGDYNLEIHHFICRKMHQHLTGKMGLRTDMSENDSPALAITKYAHKSAQNPEHIHKFVDDFFSDTMNRPKSGAHFRSKEEFLDALKSAYKSAGYEEEGKLLAKWVDTNYTVPQ